MTSKNNILSTLKRLTAVLALLIIANLPVSAQISDAFYRARWITIVAPYVLWPQQDTISEYYIGVYGASAQEVAYLDTLSRQNVTLKNKPFKAVHYKRIKDIDTSGHLHVLYVNSEYNDDISAISNRVGNKPILIITYKLPAEGNQLNHTMINLLFNKGKDRQFETNRNRAEYSGLSIDEKILAMGGTQLDLNILIDDKNKLIQERFNELLLLQQELDEQLKKIDEQIFANDWQNEQNLMKRMELEQEEEEVDKQKEIASELLVEAQRLQGQLLVNNKKIKEMDKEINEQKQVLESSRQELSKKLSDIGIRRKQVDAQRDLLEEQKKKIENQDQIIMYVCIFAGVIVFLVFIIMIANMSRKKKNKQLALLNDEVDRQKDHIQAQSQQLMQINKELEKLSIVASQTDNGVVIMDELGNIEWVNRGFTNMYGFTAKDLKSSAKDSFTGFYSNNPEIHNIKDECLTTAESHVFECEVVTKQGTTIWIQSTLTPIMDDNKQIGRLVTIDTDITRIKEQEMAIMKQGATLALQRDELAKQNEFITEQNLHISTSLTYAKTIQETVMPLEINITKYFNYFSLFIPLQIVSGDFYWFTRIPENENLAFTAAVDCTGHGVPGAFMCMIATRILSEIIVEHKNYDTKDILTQLNTGLVAALKQNETDNNDSLEICLCKFNKIDDENYEMTFSGAKRPLYIYHNDTSEFDVLKGDRKTIGGIMSKRNSTEFTSETMILKKSDKIYMTTDGFVNQFDINNKKYGSDKFLTLLKSICTMNLPDQRIVLEQEYSTHRGDAEQNDDVTIFAVQLI